MSDFLTPWTIAHQAPLFMEFSRQEYCSGLPCPPPGDLPNPAIKRRSPAAAAAKSLQSCPILCHPRDGSPPGSAVPGILQARTLEWVAISFSNAWKWKVKVTSLSRVRLLALQIYSLLSEPPRKPQNLLDSIYFKKMISLPLGDRSHLNYFRKMRLYWLWSSDLQIL